MDKNISKKPKNKPLLVKPTYQQVELGGSAIPALDRAFDILFDEVLKRRLKANECSQSVIDN